MVKVYSNGHGLERIINDAPTATISCSGWYMPSPFPVYADSTEETVSQTVERLLQDNPRQKKVTLVNNTVLYNPVKQIKLTFIEKLFRRLQD